MRTVLTVLTCALCCVGCNKSQETNTTRSPEEHRQEPTEKPDALPTNDLIADARNWASSQVHRYNAGQGNVELPCLDHFSIDDVSVGDTRRDGATAEAVVNVTVSVTPGKEPLSGCFPRHTGGGNYTDWQPGDRVTFPRRYRLEKWDSGWRSTRMDYR